jgi:hypothetical protein
LKTQNLTELDSLRQLDNNSKSKKGMMVKMCLFSDFECEICFDSKIFESLYCREKYAQKSIEIKR